eukprot:TRINITY_DN5483_c0_g1_i1.p1 TRINITY_DN5483_c0_g1~~TRINITY_DN5483_c0_g1_i1.p1  ORF type:complete len:216 (-),score=31.50 TRINITY_DN5483_c0_g1_i1:139-786(-)
MEFDRKFYISGQVLSVDEDLTHEFKGHRILYLEENPKGIGVTKRTRQHISKYLCGMLNSGKGGRLYMGVKDDGAVSGIMLTRYQMDHILVSLEDIFERYDPSVDESLYSVSFVPVFENEDILHGGLMDTEPYWHEGQRGFPHRIRQPHYCWCDLECFAALQYGLINSFYVVEINLKPITNLRVPFRDENGDFYIRRNASNEFCSQDQIESEIGSR